MHNRYVRTRVKVYANFEPNTILLSSKNYVTAKMHLEVGQSFVIQTLVSCFVKRFSDVFFFFLFCFLF